MWMHASQETGLVNHHSNILRLVMFQKVCALSHRSCMNECTINCQVRSFANNTNTLHSRGGKCAVHHFLRLGHRQSSCTLHACGCVVRSQTLRRKLENHPCGRRLQSLERPSLNRSLTLWRSVDCPQYPSKVCETFLLNSIKIWMKTSPESYKEK